MFLWVCTVKDYRKQKMWYKHQWHTQLCHTSHFDVLTIFQCCLWSVTQLMHSNMQSIWWSRKKMVNLINIKVNFCLFIQEWAKQIYLKCSELWEKDNRRITRKRLAWNLMKLRVWDITQWIHNFLLELTKFLPFPIWPCHMALTYTTPQINIICSIYTFYGFILGGIPRGCQNIFCLYFHANFDFIKYNTIENNYSNIVLECNVQFITG